MYNAESAFGLRPYPVDDFSGGMTDYYLAGNPTKCRRSYNLLITNNKKLTTRHGSQIYDSTHYIPTYVGSNPRVGASFYFQSQIFEVSARNVYYNNSGYSTLQGPVTTNPVMPSGTTSNYTSFFESNKHLLIVNDNITRPMKIYNSSGFKVRNAGLPKLASNPTVTAGAVGTENYVYTFVYYYTYTIGSEIFEDFSATRSVAVTLTTAPNTNAIAITAIPVLANGGTGNHDTANIKVKIYRTESNGTKSYYVNQVTNGTTLYNDTMSDVTLVNQEVLYTEGGVLDFDEPPECKYVIAANEYAYYLHVKESSGETFPGKVKQSNQGAFGHVPGANEITLPDEITGGGAIDRYPIIMCKGSIWRLEGVFDDTGKGNIEKVAISLTVGCVSHNSIVKIKEGLVFAGTDGFYFTDGFQCQRISEDLNLTYPSLINSATKQKRIYGAFDTENNRAWWTATADASSTDNDSCYIADFKFGLKGDVPFSYADGDIYWAPSALLFIGKTLYRSDKRGYLLVHDALYLTDPKIDIAVSPVDWKIRAIMYDYWSCALNLGTDNVRKWVSQIIGNCENVANLSMDILSYNDASGISSTLKAVRMQQNIAWGDSRQTWDDSVCVWNFDKLIAFKRNFPAQNIRCNYKQIRFKNSLTAIDNSDSLGLATVSGAALTVDLNNLSNIWPINSDDYTISFEDDGYVNEYKILTRTDATLTIENISGKCPTSTAIKWVIRGYAKGDLLSLLAYTFWYSPITTSQTPYKAQTGENA